MTINTYVLTGFIHADEPLATCSKDLKDREGKDKATPIPYQASSNGLVYYFPSSGIRGSLRRAAASVILDKTIERTGDPKPFSLDEHYAMVLGGVKGSEVMDRIGITLVEEWLSKNPMLSVFGAGDGGILGFVEGKLSVGSAYCEPGVEPTIFSGARTDEFYRNPARVKYLSDEDIELLVGRSVANSISSKVKKEIEALEADIRKLSRSKESADIERLAELKAELVAKEEKRKKDLESAGAKTVGVGMPLAGYKAIPRGEKLEHTIKLFRANSVEMGLLLATLQRFALEPLLGAHAANGLGTVSGQWNVRKVNQSGSTVIGSVKFDAFDNLVIEGDELVQALADFNAFVETGPADFTIPSMQRKNRAKNGDAIDAEAQAEG